jgi:hypothetical protein
MRTWLAGDAVGSLRTLLEPFVARRRVPFAGWKPPSFLFLLTDTGARALRAGSGL